MNSFFLCSRIIGIIECTHTSSTMANNLDNDDPTFEPNETRLQIFTMLDDVSAHTAHKIWYEDEG